MDALPEKPASLRRATARAALDALAVVSVIAAFTGAALAAAGLSWRAMAYLSIVGVLFDALFTYEFFYSALRAGRRSAWLDGLSSIAPLLLVSGPFIAGWASGDLGSAAVRGFWLGQAPYGGLAVVAALRLLRAARPFRDSGAVRARRGLRPAASAGLAVALSFAVAADALLVPGLAAAGAARRSEALATIATSRDDATAIAAARSAGVVALRKDGRALMAAPEATAPPDFIFLSSGSAEAWFSIADERRARGAYEAAAALASLAAAAALGLSLARKPRVGESQPSVPPEPRPRLADRPTGTEEIEAILGKRSL